MLDPCGNSKDGFLKKYEGFIEKVNQKNLAASDDQWEKYDEQFRVFVEECYEIHETEMTSKEKRQFWVKSARYYYKRFGKGVANELFGKKDSKFEKLKEELNNFEEGELEDLKKELNKEWKDLKKDIKEIFE